MTKKAFNPGDWRKKRKMPDQVGHDERSVVHDETMADEIERLTETIEARKVDITGGYQQWLEIGFSLKEALGEDGRSYFHRISRFYPSYSEEEADKQYDKCMRSKGEGIGPGTLFYFAKLSGVMINGSFRDDKEPEKESQTPPKGFEGYEGLRERRMPTFSQELRGKLPKVLDEIARNANSDEDADLLILGSIVTLSACLPHLSGVYGDRPVFPNLFLFVTAPASAGKGRLTLCRRLVQPIQKQLQFLYDEDMAKYKKAKADYERRKKRDPTALAPEEPKRRTLIIPANSSSTMVYQILSENDGCGLMFETEGDTLANVFASDYGNYSDGFRKAFHHEPISHTRRKDREFVELLQPKLSTVLSGTPRQIASLIPDTENGLFSRFIFYYVDFRLEWLNAFPQHKDGDNLDDTFDRIGERILRLYQNLQMNAGIRFTFTTSQKKDFNDYYRKAQLDCYHLFGDDIIASIRRLGLITYRMAMVLSVLRMADELEFPPMLYCHDEDFLAAMTISRVLIHHTVRVYKELSNRELYRPAAERSDRQRQLLDALADEFGTAEAIETAGKLGISQKSVERYLKEWRQSERIERVSHGRYRKCNPQTAIPSKPSVEDYASNDNNQTPENQQQ